MDQKPVGVLQRVEQKTILLVEDEAIIAWMTQQQLEGEGYRVLLAHSGEKAVELVCQKQSQVDLILMDINLGSGIDGTQAAQNILNAVELPVIFLSSHTDQETIEKTEKITSYGYVIKNSIPTVLFASIRMAFRLFTANQKIKEKEADFRILFENSLNGVALHEVILDEDGRAVDYVFRQVNAAFETHTGQRAQDVLNRRATEVYPGLEKTGLIEVYGRVARTGEPVTFETYFEMDHNYYSISAYPAGSGRFAVVFENITERKLSEIQLKDSEVRLRQIISNSSAGYFHIDRDGYFKEVNQAWLKMHAFDDEAEIIGRHYSLTQVDNDLEKARRIVATVLAGNKLTAGEFTRRRKDGSVGYHIFTLTPMMQNGLVIGLEGFLIDTTAQKQAEEALRENEERFHALFENAPLGYQSLDIEGNFIEVNQTWLDILGYPREEVIGRWFGDFLAPEIVDGFRERFPIFKANGKIHSEFPMLCKDGARKTIAFEGRIGCHPDGSFRQTHCILADISEQREAEAERERLKKVNQALIDKSHTQLVYLDPQFNFVVVNKAYADTCHFTPEEMIGKNHFELYPHAENKAIFERVRDTGEAVIFRDRPFVFPDQPERGVTYWDWALTPVKDGAGTVEGLVFSLVDTTERKRVEDRLMIYHQIVAHSPDRIAFVDRNYRYVIVNDTYENYSGLKREEIIGKTVAELVGEVVFTQTIKPYIDRCLVGEKVEYQEWFDYPRFGKRCMDVTYVPFRDFQNIILGVVSNIRDVTESRTAAEQIYALLKVRV